MSAVVQVRARRHATLRDMLEVLIRIGPDTLVLATMAGMALVLWTGGR
jgi:hypothetical protein